jgi:hypothetical protein
MADDEYPIQQKLADLKKTLDSDPTNVESAIRYWSGLASFGGNVVAFARAYRELSEKNGEKPRAELFDEELLQALKTRLPHLSNGDQAIVQWLIASIE